MNKSKIEFLHQPIKKKKKLTEKQVEEYAITLLKDRGLFHTLMLFAGVTHDSAEANNDKDLMEDSDLIFELAQKLNCADL